MLGHILLTAVNAVAPIVLLILFCCWLRRKEFLSEGSLLVCILMALGLITV